MWIVRLALRRPYTFVVMAVLIAILGGLCDRDDAGGHLSLHRHSRSSASCGSTAACRRRRWKAASSRISSARSPPTSNDIEHIESQSHQSIAVVRVYFPSQRSGGSGAGADRHAVPGAGPQHAAGHVSAAGPEVRRGQRADPAARPEQQDAERAGNLRSRRTISSARRSRPCRAPPFPIRSAARTARSWWI